MSSPGPQSLKSEDFFIPKVIRKKLIQKIKEYLKVYSQDHGEINYQGISIEVEVNNRFYQVTALKELVYNQEGARLKDKLTFFAYDKNEPSIILGEGATGKVILAQDIKQAKLVALKLQELTTETQFNDLSRERRNLSKTKSLIGIAKMGENIHLTAMEYHRGLTLLHVLYNFDKSKHKESPEYFQKADLDLARRLELVILACSALIYIHELKLVHRDIKPANLIFVRKWQIDELKFVDFGSSVDLEDKSQESALNILAGTFGYFAPELLGPKDQVPPYSFECDFFSLGVLILEIFDKEVNFQQERLKAEGFDLTVDKIREIFHKLLARQLPHDEKAIPSSKTLVDSDELDYAAQSPKAPLVDRIDASVASLAQHLCQTDHTLRGGLAELKEYVHQLTVLQNELKYSKLNVEPYHRIQEYQELRRTHSEKPDLTKPFSPGVSPRKSEDPLSFSSPQLSFSGIRPSEIKLSLADDFNKFRERRKSQLPAPLLYLSQQPKPSASESDLASLDGYPDEDKSAAQTEIERPPSPQITYAAQSDKTTRRYQHMRRTSSESDIHRGRVVRDPHLIRGEPDTKVKSADPDPKLKTSSSSRGVPSLSSLETLAKSPSPRSPTSIGRIDVQRSPRKRKGEFAQSGVRPSDALTRPRRAKSHHPLSSVLTRFEEIVSEQSASSPPALPDRQQSMLLASFEALRNPSDEGKLSSDSDSLVGEFAELNISDDKKKVRKSSQQ